MKKIVSILIILLATVSFGWAGEREDLQKDIQIYELQRQNMELQITIIQNEHPKVVANLNAARAKLMEMDKKPIIPAEVKK